MSQMQTETPRIELPAAGEWKVDAAHTNVTFTVRYMMLSKVRGRFGSFDGTIHIGELPEDARIEATIDAASIDTSNDMRDEHLRSPDFLDVENFPTLAFRSTRVEQVGEAGLRVNGELTIKDVTRPVALDVEYVGLTSRDLQGKARAAFTAKTEIDREEFGITWNKGLETGGVLVGPRVGIELEIQMVRPAAEQAA